MLTGANACGKVSISSPFRCRRIQGTMSHLTIAPSERLLETSRYSISEKAASNHVKAALIQYMAQVGLSLHICFLLVRFRFMHKIANREPSTDRMVTFALFSL